MSTHWPEHCWLKWHSRIFIFFHLSAFQYFYSPLCHQFHSGIKIPWLLHPLVMSWFGHGPTGGIPVCPCPFRASQTFPGGNQTSQETNENMEMVSLLLQFCWCRPTSIILKATLQKPLQVPCETSSIGSEVEPVLHLLHACMLSRFSCVRLFVTPFPSPGDEGAKEF